MNYEMRLIQHSAFSIRPSPLNKAHCEKNDKIETCGWDFIVSCGILLISALETILALVFLLLG